MAHEITRRQLLQQLGATAGAAMLPLAMIRGQEAPIMVAGKPVFSPGGAFPGAKAPGLHLHTGIPRA
jgi:hypothetical protein